MPTPKPPEFLLKAALDALGTTNGNKADAARLLGIARSTFLDRVSAAERLGLKGREQSRSASAKPRVRVQAIGVRAETVPSVADPIGWLEARLKSCGDKGVSLPENQWGLIDSLRAKGLHINEREDGVFFLNRTPTPAYLAGAVVELVSDDNNCFRFGAMGDTHIGSQYHREDVLNDLYRRYAEADVSTVFHTGNYVEGEARFNRHELTAHSMQGQVNMLVRDYPRIRDITTYAVSGDDHEGWWAQREGINIGRFTEDAFRRAGRTDWVDLGYVEAHVKLVNKNTGKHAIMAVVHPGGGSAYATSYSVQKIIESLDGGEKPAVGLYGHYHKLMAMNVRNVWVVQTGTTKDQDIFMRKKRLEAHVGGTLIDLEQDPETGAIIGMTPRMFRYFVRGYYEGRWKHGESVTLPDRGVT